MNKVTTMKKLRIRYSNNGLELCSHTPGQDFAVVDYAFNLHLDYAKKVLKFIADTISGCTNHESVDTRDYHIDLQVNRGEYDKDDTASSITFTIRNTYKNEVQVLTYNEFDKGATMYESWMAEPILKISLYMNRFCMYNDTAYFDARFDDCLKFGMSNNSAMNFSECVAIYVNKKEAIQLLQNMQRCVDRDEDMFMFVGDYCVAIRVDYVGDIHVGVILMNRDMYRCIVIYQGTFNEWAAVNPGRPIDDWFNRVIKKLK